MRWHRNHVGQSHSLLLSPTGESVPRFAHENTGPPISHDPARNAPDRRGKQRRSCAAALALAALAGCGHGGPGKLPTACQFPNGSAGVLAALRRAPAPVRLSGTPLSKCLVREADPADVQSVGAVYVDAASTLAGSVRTSPHGSAATELGYLEGAVKRGASKTAGIHYELERRLQQELDGVNTGTPEYVRGERAGETGG